MSFESLEMDVIRWSEARGILPHAKPYTQLLKAFSEMGELADAELKDSDLDREDAIGDILVCLINYCALKDLSMTGSLKLAYEQIKNRKGRMTPDGTFIKE